MSQLFKRPGALDQRKAAPPSRPRNLLLRSLSEADFEAIRPHLQLVPLNEGTIIVGQDEPITFVCFPECGVTSVADVQADGSRVEIAIVGREGMTNSQLLLGCERAPHEAMVQIGNGSSLRLEASALRTLCQERPVVRALFLRFVHALAVQTARTLASNLRDMTEKRPSRWLLMCHDRVDGEEVPLSHENIGRMLGVRRATVTDTLHILEGHGAIRCTRGLIVVRDRRRLAELAGSSYGFAEAHYSRLITPFGKCGSTAGIAHREPSLNAPAAGP